MTGGVKSIFCFKIIFRNESKKVEMNNRIEIGQNRPKCVKRGQQGPKVIRGQHGPIRVNGVKRGQQGPIGVNSGKSWLKGSNRVQWGPIVPKFIGPEVHWSQSSIVPKSHGPTPMVHNSKFSWGP